MGSTHARGSTHGVDSQTVPAKKFCVPISPLCHESTHGVDSNFSIMNIFQNTYPKTIKFSPMDHKSFVLALDAFKSEFGKIMILPLKCNKSFSSENH